MVAFVLFHFLNKIMIRFQKLQGDRIPSVVVIGLVFTPLFAAFSYHHVVCEFVWCLEQHLYLFIVN